MSVDKPVAPTKHVSCVVGLYLYTLLFMMPQITLLLGPFNTNFPVVGVAPVAVMVTAPVDALTLIPEPAVMLVTPVLVTVIAPPKDTGLPLTLIPVPALTVILEFWRFALGMPVGKSATTSDRNVGTAAGPVLGPAYTVLADWVLDVNVSVPLVVTGEPLTLKMDGADSPTLVTEPPPAVLVIVIAPVDALTLIPEPAVMLVTPVLVSVNTPPNDTGRYACW